MERNGTEYLAKDGNSIGVAAERIDVDLHPLQHQLVKQNEDRIRVQVFTQGIYQAKNIK